MKENLPLSKIYYTYDQNGNMLTKTAPIFSPNETGTIVTANIFDGLNRPTHVNVSCVQNTKYDQSISYTYEAGMLKKMTVNAAHNGDLEYTYYYNTAQRLDYMTNPSKQMVKFSYYPGGQREQKKIYLHDTDTSPFVTVNYKYDEAYLLKHLNYSWMNYYVKMNYQYNIIDKLGGDSESGYIGDTINYNIPGEFVLGDYNYRPDHSSGTFSNVYKYDDLGRLNYSKVYGFYKDKYFTSDALFRKYRETSYTNITAAGNPLDLAINNSDYDEILSTSVNNQYNELNQLKSNAVSGANGDYTRSLFYDDNGNLQQETFTGDQKDINYSYSIDNQLQNMSYETLPQTSGEYTYHWKVSNSYYYELNGRLLRLFSDNTKYGMVGSFTSDSYLYYSNDGVVREVRDSTDRTVIDEYDFTRLGREFICYKLKEGSIRTNHYFPIQNMRGDVIMVVDQDGKVSRVCDYDSSGKIIDGDSGCIIGFTGGLNVGSGLVKLGARFYDSSKNAFIQQDRYMGDPSDPLSLNRYVYCNMDPVNYVDPTGFNPILSFLLGYAFGQSLPEPNRPYSEAFLSGLQVGTMFLAGNEFYNALKTYSAIKAFDSSNLNFTKTTTERMENPDRFVPVQTLKDAIKYGQGLPDPQGSNATMFYTTMEKNGKLYNLDVLYDFESNTVFHFKYTQKALGPLEAINQ